MQRDNQKEGEEETEEKTEEEEITFAVTGINLSVDPLSYTGYCPAAFTWAAEITVNGSVTVTYQWEPEGGSSGPPQNISFSSAGSKIVTRHASVSAGWPDTSSRIRLHVITPNYMLSDYVTITLTRYPDIYVRPTTVNFGDVACGSSSEYGIIVEDV